MDSFAEAEALHRDCTVVDGHADTPQRFLDESWSWAAAELGTGQLSAATAADALDAEFFALWAEPVTWAGQFRDRTDRLLEATEAEITAHPEALALCTTATEVRAAKAAGRFAALLAVEGGHSIEDDLDALRHYFRRGVRYMTLTWSNTSNWCDSSNDAALHGGLTPFGCDVVREMNRLGMIVDISHVSDAAFWQTLRTTRAPLIASHSAARALTNSPRNLTDPMLRAVADNGGVVLVNFYAAFVSESCRAAWMALHDERATAEADARASLHAAGKRMLYGDELRIARRFQQRLTRPPLSALVDHVDHILRLCGPDHVGLGSDFDGIPLLPEGLDTAADLPRLTAALLERGWPPGQLRGFLGENILRVLDQVQSLAG